ncbi:hypothetical protein [Paenibacillus sp. sgz302251]
MDDKNNKTDYRPDITNYDYVWGSDQDQYLKEEEPEEKNLQQENEQDQK